MAKITCYYCDRWHKSKQATQERRYCEAVKKRIKRTRKRCKFFVPTEASFWCDKHHCHLKLIQCVQRRRNPMSLNKWEKCKRCRQWDKEVRDIIEDYWLTGKKIIPFDNPGNSKRVIKRRDKGGRVIKRRKGKPRKIKRRSKPKRVIRRRSNA